MLDSLFSAPDTGAQLPSKITECFGGCVALVSYRTNARVYCSSCKIKNKRESARRAAEKQRRKRGIPKVKGETFTCQECATSFVATSKSRAKYCCEECYRSANGRESRARSYADDRGGTRKRVGRLEVCTHCGDGFLVSTNGGNHCYCEACRELNKAGSLPHLREARRQWRAKRYREDPKFALNDFMRCGILKSLGDKKDGNSWTAFVDYTVDDLKAHLERQFLPGMTWDNRGINGWHIDHILPISSFDYDSPDHPDFKACWALTNLRPMWGGDNIRKKDKRLFLI